MELPLLNVNGTLVLNTVGLTYLLTAWEFSYDVAYFLGGTLGRQVCCPLPRCARVGPAPGPPRVVTCLVGTLLPLAHPYRLARLLPLAHLPLARLLPLALLFPVACLLSHPHHCHHRQQTPSLDSHTNTSHHSIVLLLQWKMYKWKILYMWIGNYICYHYGHFFYFFYF